MDMTTGKAEAGYHISRPTLSLSCCVSISDIKISQIFGESHFSELNCDS